jgi:hypothetical protein
MVKDAPHSRGFVAQPWAGNECRARGPAGRHGDSSLNQVVGQRHIYLFKQ